MTAIECGTIYKVTNPEGKVYIGQTTEPVENRWKHYERVTCRTQTKLYNSLKNYGYENHTFEVVMTGITSKEMLNWYEIFYIAIYNSYKNGLNSSLGGEGVIKPEDELKYGMRTTDKRYYKIHSKAHYEENKEKLRVYGKIKGKKESVIRNYFGYTYSQWNALPKNIRAQKRLEFDRKYPNIVIKTTDNF